MLLLRNRNPTHLSRQRVRNCLVANKITPARRIPTNDKSTRKPTTNTSNGKLSQFGPQIRTTKDAANQVARTPSQLRQTVRYLQQQPMAPTLTRNSLMISTENPDGRITDLTKQTQIHSKIKECHRKKQIRSFNEIRESHWIETMAIKTTKQSSEAEDLPKRIKQNLMTMMMRDMPARLNHL